MWSSPADPSPGRALPSGLCSWCPWNVCVPCRGRSWPLPAKWKVPHGCRGPPHHLHLPSPSPPGGRRPMGVSLSLSSMNIACPLVRSLKEFKNESSRTCAGFLIPQAFSHGPSGEAAPPGGPAACLPRPCVPAFPPTPSWLARSPPPDAAIPKPSWNFKPSQVSRMTHGGCFPGRQLLAGQDRHCQGGTHPPLPRSGH